MNPGISLRRAPVTGASAPFRRFTREATTTMATQASGCAGVPVAVGWRRSRLVQRPYEENCWECFGQYHLTPRRQITPHVGGQTRRAKWAEDRVWKEHVGFGAGP